MENLKRRYEIMFILDIDNQTRTEKIKQELLDILNENNTKILKKEDHIISFAYKINNKLKGNYCILQVETDVTTIKKFNDACLLKQKRNDVIRFIIINLDNEKFTRIEKHQKKQPNFEGQREFARPERPYQKEYRPREDRERKPSDQPKEDVLNSELKKA